MPKNPTRKHRPTNAARSHTRAARPAASQFKIEVGPTWARKDRSKTTQTERMLLGMVADVCDVMDANDRLLKYIDWLMKEHGITLNCGN